MFPYKPAVFFHTDKSFNLLNKTFDSIADHDGSDMLYDDEIHTVLMVSEKQQSINSNTAKMYFTL